MDKIKDKTQNTHKILFILGGLLFMVSLGGFVLLNKNFFRKQSQQIFGQTIKFASAQEVYPLFVLVAAKQLTQAVAEWRRKEKLI